MTKPTPNEIEYLYYGSYYNEEGEYTEDLNTVFESVALQYIVGATSYDYIADSIEALVVVKNTETGELWGATIAPNSWHEEPLEIEDDDIKPVVLQPVTREEYVYV